MSRNIVPRINKGADLGTADKNWNRLFTDTVILRGEDLRVLLNNKASLDMLMAKGDIFVATGTGAATRLPAGADGYVLKANSGVPEGLMWGPAGARQELTGNITVTVGETGDFPTINAALENIVALYYPKYISGNNCPRVTIQLLSGFIMNEQIFVNSLDLSWITITGVDPETIVNPSEFIYYPDARPVFYAERGFLPVIGQLFNVGTTTFTSNHGVYLRYHSKAHILPGCGIKNAKGYGLFVFRSSAVTAGEAIFSGALNHGVYVASNSTAYVRNIDASNAGNDGIHAREGSMVDAMGANISGAYNDGIYATRGSIINASSVNGGSEVGLYAVHVTYGSIVNAYNVAGEFSQDVNTITNNGIIFK